MNQTMFHFLQQMAPLEEKALAIFDARLRTRQLQADPSVSIHVRHSSFCAPDEFRLSGSRGAKELYLDCGGPAAFLYAVGKILRSGKYKDGIFTPGSWRGCFRPVKPIRCVYLASHFCNVFEMWPVEKMEEYIEDLALLGYNYFVMTPGSRVKIQWTPE